MGFNAIGFEFDCCLIIGDGQRVILQFFVTIANILKIF